MKPVNELPATKYGEKIAARHKEIQEFVANGCKYAELSRFAEKSSADTAGYYCVLEKYDFDVKIRLHNMKDKVFAERVG